MGNSTPLLQPLIDFGIAVAAGNIPVLDKITKHRTPLVFTPSQQKLYDCMLEQARKGQPIRGLVPKYRQGGISTLMQSLSWFLCARIPNIKARTLAHTDPDSKAIFDLAHRVHEWTGFKATGLFPESAKSIEFPHSEGSSDYECRTMGGGSVTGRGSDVSILHVTELAHLQREKNLDADAITAILNTVADAPNTIIILEGTGNGPTGEFYSRCKAAESGESPRWFLCFLPWYEDARHQRDVTADDAPLTENECLTKATYGLNDRQIMWYRDKEQDQSKTDLAAMKREYPTRLDDCFEVSSGRVFFTFDRDVHVRDLGKPTQAQGWKLYRGIDWGFSNHDPFVCLWAAHKPGGKPSLVIHPDCDPLITEMIAYCRDEHGKPIDLNNHGPDVLRYLVGTFRFTGQVYFYRSLYIKPCADLSQGIREIHRLSGWKVPSADDLSTARRGAGESYQSNVADRSQPGSISMSRKWGITPLIGQVRPTNWKLKGESQSKGEIEDGISIVLSLLAGESLFDPRPEDREAELFQRINQTGPTGRPIEVELTEEEERILRDANEPEAVRARNWRNPVTEFLGVN